MKKMFSLYAIKDGEEEFLGVGTPAHNLWKFFLENYKEDYDKFVIKYMKNIKDDVYLNTDEVCFWVDLKEIRKNN